MDQLLIECYNWIYKQPNKSCSYKQLADYIYTFNNPDLNFKIFEDLKFNDQVRLKYQELTNCHQLPYYDSKNFTVRNLQISIDSYTQLTKENQLADVILNHNEFKSTSDTDIYILSLNFFHINWIEGVSFFEYKHYILNVVKIWVIDERLKALYREITKEPSLSNEHYRKIASLDSMLGLLEYKELQHSLQESKEAKKEAKKANFFARTGIFLSVAGLIISIVVAIYQINQSEDQFKTEQKQYKTEQQESKKSHIQTIPTNKVFINKK
ncbi:hypothetical protein [Cytophaga hutchinsonii]|uniref:Transmembrane protein n=1 Tax=Cytophaga hutchinsonii (strain ATCC 33406 / DSM 1761 / CIP 103989 / NBRC 15051 / NCIMB 9469 / D465) TaxID=269798 RepID=A0A6N4SP51_CYTH3|nr:hypothetical protein [Cytophaga hutchinsonii]ABG58096.1 hypothetical protein CHU_0809 [Cytophaga hutchinsonii ATCC 33406]SFX13436.1 hypothetical protein SAMN04487930_101645 [Cytophaga hutchinsonii ATCC 33406]